MSTLRVDNIKGRTASTVNVPSGETFAVAGNQTVGGTLTVSGGGSLNTTGTVTVGDLVVNGTTTTINSTVLSVDDKNIELGSVASPSDTTAAGGGITLKGATDKTFLWDNTSLNWTPTPGFTVQHTQEPVRSVTVSSAGDFTITYNYNTNTENVFFIQANETGNFTLALTNLPTTLGKAYTFTFIINPNSSTTCRPKDATINGGSAIAIRWAGSTAPSNMSTNGDEDIHTLTLVRRPDTTAWMAFCNFSMGMGS